MTYWLRAKDHSEWPVCKSATCHGGTTKGVCQRKPVDGVTFQFVNCYRKSSTNYTVIGNLQVKLMNNLYKKTSYLFYCFCGDGIRYQIFSQNKKCQKQKTKCKKGSTSKCIKNKKKKDI